MFNFKNKEDYQAQRKALMDKIQGLLASGNTAEANSEMENVRAMDEDFENQATAQANFNALNGAAPNVVNVANGIVASMGGNNSEGEDIYDSMDYRKAFMNHILKGAEIPAQFVNATTTTSDAGAAIPTTVLDRIIEKLENVGTIYNLVTRTSYKGGLSIPASNVKPVATWVAEGKGSDVQKKGLSGTVSFTWHKLRCAVAISLEVDTMAISAFETALVNSISKAMISAIEDAIINGDGNGKPTGILAVDVPEGQKIAVGELTYEVLTAAEAAVPEEYESNAVWGMSKKTFMQFIGMTDQAGQPIARVNYGISGKPERYLLGRPVVLSNHFKSFSEELEAGTKFGVIFNFEDYILNENLNITLKKYEDNDTDDQVTKAVALVDGKVVDASSLVVLSKNA